MSLSEYGFDAYCESLPNTKEIISPSVTARVIAEYRGAYTCATERDKVSARLTGAFRDRLVRSIDYPAVGDWVVLEQGEDADNRRIESILPRRTILTRKLPGRVTEEQTLAANVDTVCIVFALDEARNYNVRLAERYVTAVWDSGAVPLIVLNKADLSDNAEVIREHMEIAAPRVEIIGASTVTGEGVHTLSERFSKETTVAFVGRSGVGKSSLVNAIAGETIMAVGEVREADSKGRHTTTHRQLTRLKSGILVVDTPGLREFGLFTGEDALDSTFDEIAEIAKSCRFSDCAHQSEPGCAVQAALEDGSLNRERYENYLRLQRELAYMKRKEAQRANKTRDARGKQIAAFQKQLKKLRGR